MPHRNEFVPSEIFDTGVPVIEEDPRPELDVESLVGRMIDEAIEWREEHLDPVQEKATDYYMARPFGDEQTGRSQVVTTEVRDSVQAVLPSFMRVFFGSERVVEFKPDGPEDVELAKQQTEYVNYIFTEDNPGFKILHSVLKDALVRKMGVVKWWWEDKVTIEGSENTGLNAEQIAFLQMQPGIEVELLDADEDELLEAQSEVFDVEVRRISNRGRVRVEAVPPEEFIFSPTARSLEDARLVGHVRDVPADELVAMGIDRDLIEDARGGSEDARRGSNTLKAARQIDQNARGIFQDEQDESTEPIPFAEVFVRIDEDGDDISELRKIQAIGEDRTIVSDEVVDSRPFALFMPDPEPHTLVGLSLADYVMDLQRIKSAITRGMLDSLTLSLNPATEVVEGQVNMKDVLNTEVGRIIRVRKPGMMREVETSFVGREALPVLQYLDEVKDDRTGKNPSGLDPDALQSSTRAAVAATVEAAKDRTELFARIFAETGMTDLFKGLLRMVVQHQDEARMVRLRNEFVEVDPRHWEADKDVTVNVALGTGLVEEKLQMLGLIADKQEQHVQQGSPLVDLSQLRNTYARMVELAGFRNPDEFFKPFGPQEDQAFRQAQAQSAGEPDPETKILAQIEMAKVKAKAQTDAAELQLKLAQLRLEREKLAGELAIKGADVQRKGLKDQLDAAIDRAQQELDATVAAIDAAKTMSETRVGE